MRALPLAFLLLVGCGNADGPPPTASDDHAATLTTTVAALDTLSERSSVSLTGRVLDHAPGERELVLDDGTGLVHVRLPEDPPGLVGHRLFVHGALRRDDGAPLVEAVEWLYDSTAISVHSD